jgi:type III restriction enzyme
MAQAGIDHLIINSPYVEPRAYWKFDPATARFEKTEGRRPAGYVVATPGAKSLQDPGIFVPIPLVETIRPRVKAWRAAGYPGASGTTRRLLEHWHNAEGREDRRFFFCQLEAIETLIWLSEAPAADRVGADIPADGGTFKRLCSKMATGSGKTVVMAMLIAWQVLNKVVDPQNARYSKNIFVVAPGLTVKRRLQVLYPSDPNNFYDAFDIVPSSLKDKLHQGRVLVENWHTLNWETEKDLAKKKSVDKRGVMSDEAYARHVLGPMAKAQNLVIINDEAHHAWRVAPDAKPAGLSKEEVEEATIWVGGLDRLQRARGIQTCFDFSATPFVSTGKRGSEEALFGWIVSDFGLNDAIESGLVKTPRVVIRDDGQLSADTKSRFYHIYRDPDVTDDLNRKAEETDPLPDLIINGYALLGKDWQATAQEWQKAGFATPPVMITVANRTETAARIKYAFDHNKMRIAELSTPDRTLHIDSKVLAKAEAETDTSAAEATATSDDEGGEDDADEEAAPTQARKFTKKEQAALLRETVDTVGKAGKPGEQIQNVISVGMLSEGWDARTVTHIMGLRAFTSQLLCEQVVGRGLRRTSYEVDPDTGLFAPEYVNIFGVPFTFMPHEDPGQVVPKVAKPKFPVEPDPRKRQFEISWPNIVRIEHVYKPALTLDLAQVKPLTLDAYHTATLAEMAPVIDGKPDVVHIAGIDLEELGRTYRQQKIVFETARDLYDQMRPNWKGNKEYLLAQLIRLVEQFIASDKIQIVPPMFYQDDLKRRILITLNMNKVVQHIWEAIRFENTETIEPQYDRDRPIRSTGDMPTWYTSKPSEYAAKSHINRCVFDSAWEASEAFELDRNDHVEAWAKNDHLGFEILYTYQGVVHKYYPDYLIRLKNGAMLVLEVKGQDTQRDQTKREFLNEWVKAVNQHGGFGQWQWAVSKNPADVKGILQRAMISTVDHQP